MPCSISAPTLPRDIIVPLNRQEDKDDERYQINGGCTDPATNTCLWDTQPKDVSAGKFLFLRDSARKLFKDFYDKWQGKLCGQQGVWLTLSPRSLLPFSLTTSRKIHFKSQEIPPDWQLMRDTGVKILEAAAEMPLNRSWACTTTLTFYDRLGEITSLCSPRKRQWCPWASIGRAFVDFVLPSPPPVSLSILSIQPYTCPYLKCNLCHAHPSINLMRQT